jgi:hypothetical protein
MIAELLRYPSGTATLAECPDSRGNGLPDFLRICPDTQVGCSWCDWLYLARRRLMMMIIDQYTMVS